MDYPTFLVLFVRRAPCLVLSLPLSAKDLDAHDRLSNTTPTSSPNALHNRSTSWHGRAVEGVLFPDVPGMWSSIPRCSRSTFKAMPPRYRLSGTSCLLSRYGIRCRYLVLLIFSKAERYISPITIPLQGEKEKCYIAYTCYRNVRFTHANIVYIILHLLNRL